MPEVRLCSLSKSFSGVDVIRNVSVEIADGEFCVLVGPSGSGKSTLLRLIAGLEEPTDGQIFMGNRDVTRAPPKARDIAMVFQSYALYPQLSVRDNMGFGLRLAGEPTASIKTKVDAAADILGLTPLLDRFPRQLSGGQRQRVAMGRAMVRAPSVFLFDEPLSNLDASLRSSVRAEIRAMHARSKTTSVYVTHDQVEAMTMGDRIVVLRNGAVEQTGTPHALYEKPVNRFVAGFIGTPAMNQLEGQLESVGDCVVRFSALGQSIELPLQLEAPTFGECTLGLRPEHCRLASPTTPPGPDHLALPCQIVEVEFTGADTFVKVRTPIGDLVCKSDDREQRQSGDAAAVHVSFDRLYLFDSKDQRIPFSERGR
ncbi:MAG: ABC transporter ATP-binding protein [Rhodoferax sp.]|nr:ABC transporter ATP-binding protein [Rhodoferax sp.]